VLMKRWPMAVNTVVLTGWMMLFGGVPMCVAALFMDGVPAGVPSLWPLLGLLYNIVVGFMFCYWAWNRLVLLVPVAVSSLASLITPLVGVLAGAWLLDEQIGWREGAAAALILSAVAVLAGDRLRQRSTPVT
jgi:drug/metabolite transporter (DMT)-like permease